MCPVLQEEFGSLLITDGTSAVNNSWSAPTICGGCVGGKGDDDWGSVSVTCLHSLVRGKRVASKAGRPLGQ
jgi:hypothetical protein